MQNIRETDAIAQMVRIFEDPDITHVHDKIDPLDDIEIINWELSAADVETITKHKDKIQKDVKRNDKDAVALSELLDRILKDLENNILVSAQKLTDEELLQIKHLHLLTAKPFLYILNKQAGGENLDEIDDDRYRRLLDYFDSVNALFVKLDASTELDINEMSNVEKSEMRGDMGIPDGEGIDELIKQGYNLLGLMTYLTTGPMETRGWTVKKGSTAPQAAGAIHTDFEKNFIRAEVIEWDKLVEAGSKAVARDKGWLRLEGKDYTVKDGDVIEFKT